MKLKDIQNIYHQELDVIYGKEEVSSFFNLLIEYCYRISRIQLVLNPEITITKAEQNPIFDALNRLKNQEPIQYILGETTFYNLPIKVDKNTLIPRPETEELVHWLIQDFTKNQHEKAPQILDIGTGSGCIAIAMAKNLPNAKIYALDVSKNAIDKAVENAKLNQVTISFFHADILNYQSLSNELKNIKFDAIVSNPPYVRNLEKLQIKPNVLNNEPHLALFVKDENPLQFYQAIAQFSNTNLKPKGKLYFEINEYLGEEMVSLMQANNFEDIILKKDIFDKNRMLKAVKKTNF